MIEQLLRDYHLPDSGANQEVFRSPTRVDMLLHLRDSKKISIPELATKMDVSPDTLYHHMSVLVSYHLAEISGYRKNGRHTEALYSRRVITPDELNDNNQHPDRVAGMISGVLQAINKRVRSAFMTRNLKFSGSGKNLHFQLHHTWLQSDDLNELSKKLADVTQFLEECRENQVGEKYSVMVIAVPVVAEKKIRASKGLVNISAESTVSSK